ncbi:hypothetical protein Fmac_011022 [Flemingia macrophylla]|uniref:Lipoprotein n=1 Tax=Flemingia macrophylla TaxID=520843 RepID=A0ABD1ML90_9FABA
MIIVFLFACSRDTNSNNRSMPFEEANRVMNQDTKLCLRSFLFSIPHFISEYNNTEQNNKIDQLRIR